MSAIFTLDFEASCLPRHGRSFPIEVGIADDAGQVWSWLIRPEAAWADWTWTAEAEGLHGIGRERLMDEGLPAAQVVRELGAVLDGQSAYADSHLDADWMRTLEMTAGARPMMVVRHIEALVDKLRLDEAAVARAVAAVGAGAGPRHRAGPDALWLQALVAELRMQASADGRAPFSIAA